MSAFRLGLVVHAVRLDHELDRLLNSLTELGSVMDNVRVCLITENNYPFMELGDPDLTKFNPALAKNIGLREVLKDCDGAACVDADYIIPPGLLELCMEPSIQNFHLWVRRRDITEAEAKPRKWVEWMKLPVFVDCRGSWNYLSKKNWFKLGGFNELTWGFGGDDDLLQIQSGHVGIERRRLDGFPLVHIAHTLRPWSGVNARGEENLKHSANYETQANYLLEPQPCPTPTMPQPS